MSVERIITENLDIWTSAIKTKSASGRGSSTKLELYGIKRLKDLVLSLAIHGKLTTQNISDSSVDELISVLVSKNKTDGNKVNLEKVNLSTVVPFQIPESWRWLNLGFCARVFSGNTFKSQDFSKENGCRVIKITNAGVGKLVETDEFLPERYKEEHNKFLVFEGDIILALTRPYISDGLKVSLCNKTYDKSLLNQRVAACRAYINNRYLYLVLRSSYVLNTYQNRFSGNGLQPNLKVKDVTELPIPIPPEEEQKRIVAKVDALLALCDQLESQTEASIKAHQTLVKSLLETLTNAKDADELNESWQRISAHFDVLFTTEDSIDQLKQTILQLAVMGKLVKQDPNDEPASKLLERIEVEKVQLIKDKKIKKQTELKEVNESDFPFSTPEGWAVVRLGALIPQFQNGVSSRGDKKGKETIVLRLADIKDWRISENDTRRLIINEETIEKYLLKKGDTLIIRVNGSSEIVGRFITVEKVTDAIYCDHFIRMRFPIPCIEPNYLAILGSSRLVRDKISDLFISTAGQKTVNQTHISSLTLSIPPIMEQKRISERVRYLVAICDELKSKLQTVQRTISNVADSVKANY
ncbi:restriction endonuclease subunit S [Alteromonas sp. McT4-15]|uniref:restriction endonuclease subunit S n=1 Tax=Alteromonas sp. McT4-15 TaxID=2881256 RepID=UPI001CF7FC76|nr:restriction endonuclease subunit S [Alteromonas sp. McT4-15]MCB4436843.1 restriction endonuclease subunit S [Alteromonas sp. McT4-15]